MEISLHAKKYIVVGICATLIEWLVFYVGLNLLAVHYIFAATISFTVASSVNFVCNKYWNFENESTALARQYLVHFSIGLTGLCLTYALLYSMIEIIGLHPMLAKIISSGLLAFYSYSAHKHITFGRHFFPA